MDDGIKEELERPLSPAHVKQRTQAGTKLDYIEGWHAIAEANRIFGFDGWSRETVVLDCVRAPEIVDQKTRVGYIAKVRVIALGVVREGSGYGSGICKDAGDAHESAIKEAETDAMKRALMTFGWPFGLALYDKARANVSTEADVNRKSKSESRDLYTRIERDVDACASADEVASLMRSDEMLADLATLPADWEASIRARAIALYKSHKAIAPAKSALDSLNDLQSQAAE